MKILVLNGPNINMLGIREPEHYGKQTYEDLKSLVLNNANGCEIEFYQSNHEGDLVDAIQKAYFDGIDGIIFNPAAYTHTSVALLDALKSTKIPCVEVHISKVENRDSFRQISYVREACFKTITGKGLDGYVLALEALKEYLKK
ncbi:MAG: type II 3-dehydroquinate dehydratase [Clostridia bacterium]|nr:type II 3-dehydroquinate dehydratase [Clostridia bacterium]